MSASIIAWDTAELNAYMDSMIRKAMDLERKKEFLTNIDKNVQTAWKGIAGASFDEHMEVDIKNFNSVLEDIYALNTDLKKAIDKYENCEAKIRSEIQDLSVKIH